MLLILVLQFLNLQKINVNGQTKTLSLRLLGFLIVVKIFVSESWFLIR